MVKSQILAGGRGLGTFKSVLKGGVHIVKSDQVADIAGNVCNLYYSSSWAIVCYSSLLYWRGWAIVRYFKKNNKPSEFSFMHETIRWFRSAYYVSSDELCFQYTLWSLSWVDSDAYSLYRYIQVAGYKPEMWPKDNWKWGLLYWSYGILRQ